MKQLLRRAASLSMVLLLLMGVIPFSVCAVDDAGDTSGEPDAASVEITESFQVKVSLDGDVPDENAAFTFLLEGDDEGGDPMPEHNTVTIHGAGEAVFEPIDYTSVGVYNYTLRQIDGGEKGYTYDDTVYHVSVTVRGSGTRSNALTVSMSGCREGEDEKVADYEFINTYAEEVIPPVEEPTTPSEEPATPDTPAKPTTPSTSTTVVAPSTTQQKSSPQTGDNANPGYALGLMLLSGTVLAAGLVLSARRKKR
jgi:pilin isopeptide linkage protein